MMATAPARITAPPRTRRRRAEYLEQVKRLTLEGRQAKDIAVVVGRSRSAVSLAQKALGLSPHAIRLLAPPPPPKPKPEPPAPRTGTWELSRADAESLRQWRKKTGDSGSLTRFVSQIVQVAVVDYRQNRANRTALPLSGQKDKIEVASNDCHRTKMSAAAVEKIRQLRAEKVPVSELAKRFGVTHSTIRRVLEKEE